MTTVRYTRELLAKAAREAGTWDEAVRVCGGEPTRYSKRYVREKMLAAGLDISHIASRAVRHTEEVLREAVLSSHCIKDVVRHLGISNVGGNRTHISRRIKALGIDTSHFVQPERRGRAPRISLVLRSPEDGRVAGPRLRRELLRIGVPEQCAMCGNTEWCGKPILLEVDHLSGDWWDNRPENLRLMCPNCHAVTDTYRGRKRSSA